MRKTLITILITTLLATGLAGCNPVPTKPTNSNSSTNSDMPLTKTDDSNAAKYNKYASAPPKLSAEELKNKKAVLHTTKGDIEIKLFGEEAPITVSNYIFLVREKFYDNLTFHRREEGFVIQGGDPLGTGYGGPGYRFPDEKVTRSYKHGTVAMANSGPNTNGSQFFIMLADVPLPPLYTIFGEVISDIHVVDQIQIGDKIISAEIVDL